MPNPPAAPPEPEIEPIPSGEAAPLAALILAAGESSRMGRPKPLLPLGDDSVLARLVQAYQRAGVRDILVVNGHWAAEVAEEADRLGVPAILNADYRRGMFSSIQAGAAALAEDIRGFFMHPVDVALVRPATIRLLADVFFSYNPWILYPRHKGRRGHPPLLSRMLAPEILAHDGDGGLRAVLNRRPDRARDLDVDDPAVLWDMDTPADYERILKAWNEIAAQGD
jgi:CTP:molybdopterin cytidylyltransferase MocA